MSSEIVDYARKQRELLERRLGALITEFTDETGLFVRSVDIQILDTSSMGGPRTGAYNVKVDLML